MQYSEKKRVILELMGVKMISSLQKGEIDTVISELLALRHYLKDGSKDAFTASEKECIVKVFAVVMQIVCEKKGD